MAKYLKSSNIKVFPSSKRSDYFDRNARLNSEQNLVSIINRLTSRNSFVIDGLTVNEAGDTLAAGKCNIHGYLFTILNDVSLSGINHSNGNYLCFVIRTTSYKGERIQFEELIALDAKVTQNNGGSITLDSKDATENGDFNGIQLDVVSGLTISDVNIMYNPIKVSETSNSVDYLWYLPLAVSNGTKWETIKSNDDTTNNNRWNELKINVSDVLVEAGVDTNQLSTDTYTKPQDLLTWLQHSFII